MHLLVVSRRQLVGGADRVEVLRGGPAGPVLGAVLVELHGVEHRDDRKIISHDARQALNGLLLRRRIRGRGVLVQKLIGLRVVPLRPVGGAGPA